MTRTAAKYHLERQTGMGLHVREGQLLRVIDPQGEQVSDLAAFAAEDSAERLSPGRTIDYAGKHLPDDRRSPLLEPQPPDAHYRPRHRRPA